MRATATRKGPAHKAPLTKKAPRRTAAKAAPARVTRARVAAPALPAVKPAPPAPKPAGPFEPYRQALLARRAELISNLEESRFDTAARMGRVAEEDQAQLSHEEFISVRRNSMDYGALRLVEAAIESIDSGEYGTCLECEEPIAPRRLAAVPWAKHCVRCQEQLSRSESHHHSPVGQTADW